MKNAILDAPVRIYWDINFSDPSGSALQKEDILKIADRVISCKPFFVNLGEDILSYEHLKDLLEKFKNTKIKLSLASSNLIGEEKSKYFLKQGYFEEHKIDFLEFKLDPHTDKIKKNKAYLLKIKDTLNILAGLVDKLCPSLVINSDNYFLLPDILEFCIKNGIKYFKMPNTFINERAKSKVLLELLKNDDMKKLEDLLQDNIGHYRSNLKFFIHDLFIFNIFFPEKKDTKARTEYGGCQAGNALCYIDQKGKLYMCSSLFVSLGSVLEQDIKTLFKNEKRKEYKKKIDEQFADKCVRCLDFSDCKGGCRGVVYFINESFLMPDPLCPYVK